MKKVLVVELAGLGDNVHLLPALWLVRRQWPEAELHVMVREHVASLFRLTPWVDRIREYPSLSKPGLAESLRWIPELRSERFDCAINTTGSDRSSLLTRATGAPRRIGRLPADGGPPGWRWLFTEVVETPFYTEPMYWQKWRCLRKAGIGVNEKEPEFHVEIDASLRRTAGIDARDERRYVVVSPFTTADARELPAEQVATIVRGLRVAHPEMKIVVACADTDRERSRLPGLLTQLREPPWRSFAGTLDVAALAAVIEKAALVLCGDTGSLHLAMMTGAPAVAWFRAHKGEKEWIPRGERYRVLVAEGGEPDALHGIETAEVIAAANAVLR